MDDFERQATGATSNILQRLGMSSSSDDIKRHFIYSDKLRELVQKSLVKKLFPELKKAWNYRASHVERYTIGCLRAGQGYHYKPDRHNLQRATQHRQFVVNIALNADAQGGDIKFPEYGQQFYQVATGSALVYSGSLLQVMTPVKKGQQYYFSAYLFDEQGSEIKRKNTLSLKEV